MSKRTSYQHSEAHCRDDFLKKNLSSVQEIRNRRTVHQGLIPCHLSQPDDHQR